MTLPPISYEALEANNRHTHANLNACIEERDRLREREAQLKRQRDDWHLKNEAAEARVVEWEARCDRMADLEQKASARVARLGEALTITLEMLDGLADQQAMPDDWWKPNAERARRALAHEEEA